MNSATIDKNDSQAQFKTDDADSYNAVVDYFDKYTERFTRHLPLPMLELGQVPDNAKILDVGTGTGVIALNIIDKLGTNGSVVGIDLSDGMMETAARKAEAQGCSDKVTFVKMDAEKLEFEENSFDAALSLYALRHFPNPDKSVEEILRVLKPGGRIVAAVGSRPALLTADGITAAFRKIASVSRSAMGKELSACTFIDSLVEKYLPEKENKEIAGWVGEHHGFTGSIEKLVRDAGFVDVKTGWKGQYSIIETAEDFWLLQMTFSSLARKRIAGADPKIVGQLKKEFYAQSEAVLAKNGRLVYQTGAAIVSGKKPN